MEPGAAKVDLNLSACTGELREMLLCSGPK